MTDWKTVYGSCEPSTLDTTSSSFVVYQRKNIHQRGSFIWQYEERKLTREEYSMILIDSKLDSDATAAAAFKDSAGNVISDTYATKTALSAGLNSKLDSDATAAAAFKDSSGNVITDTYATKTELNTFVLSGAILPKVIVSSESGNTVTMSKDDTTLTATESSGTWEFNVPSYGDWIITATDGQRSNSKTISIDTVKIYNTSV